MNKLVTMMCIAGALVASDRAGAQILDLSWHTVDGGGAEASGEGFTLLATIGQADAGVLSGVGYEISGGFCLGGAAACYANCDGSTSAPVLNVNDFVCFQQKYAAGDVAANCDGSTSVPLLNVNDFVCFQQKYAAGCP